MADRRALPLGRLALLATGGLALLAGLDAALVLLGLPAPVRWSRLPEVHGMLLVLGFVGTLVALERAVALGRGWGYLGPAGLGGGGLLLLSPLPVVAGGWSLVVGSGVLVAVYVPLWSRQPSAAVLVQAGGAVLAVGAALLWLAGVGVPYLLPWLAGFLVLTVIGERLELARVGVLSAHAEPAAVALAAGMVVGALAALLWPVAGTALLGAAVLGLTAWAAAHDVARRTARSTGLPRFMAACLLTAYCWLAVAGAVWLVAGPVVDGGAYDAVVHAVFLGFVMSMVMAHAPVILPAVLRRPLPYHRLMYVPLVLLHVSLALRVGVGDARGVAPVWQVGGVLNIIAVLLFVAVAAWSAATAPARTTPAGGRSRPGGGPVTRTSWHVRAGAVVVAWLAALVVVTLVHPFVPASRWLLVHLLVLGAASNAILVWSWHFAAALLRLPDEVMRPGQVPRLVAFNAGAVAVVAGTVADVWALVLLGGLVVAGVAVWHAAALLRRMRQALPSRFAVTVRYYVAAGMALPLGVGLGVTMARGTLTDALHARLVVAHALLNLLGWVGLTVLGTLVTLWPTMLRARIADGAEQVARRMLPVLAAGVVLAAAGALAGIRAATALGVTVYLAGLLAVAVPHARESRRKAPVEASTSSVLAGLVWLVASLVALALGLATADTWSQAGERVGSLTAPLLAGFAAQVLLGALTYLVPVVLGGGPSVVRATSAELGRFAAARAVATNAGLLLCVLPVPSLVRVLVSVVVLAALASFLPLVVRAALVARRLRGRPAVPAGPEPRLPAQRRTGVAAVGLAAVVLAAAGGVALDPAAAGVTAAPTAAAVAETGRTTTVEVRVEGMRFVPDVVDVPAGDRLVVVLRNTGNDRHDLVLQNGSRTPRIAPGDQATLDAGVVGADLDGWCSVAGHRQMGMVLRVRAVGAPSSAQAAGRHDHAAGPSAADALDLMAAPGPDVEARDARLVPAPSGVVHRVTLTVGEVEREVAPGVTQTLWTFNGTAPGPTLRGTVGDVFDVTLVNDGTIGHSIDFHAGALAPDGPMRTIQPGESLTYRFTATRSGIWMYHCSTMPMALHIANGMFGAVVIDPPDLPAVDREYLLVQSELYLGAPGGPADADKISAERPDLVVFNGYANQYDHDPLPARVGERVRIWVLAAGPQRGSAFHVVGGQFDAVWQEGAYVLPPDTPGGAQVLGLAPAQGGFVELEMPEAGHYPFVTHAMVDAERGAHGVLRVTP